jgi:hypothetical protein
MPKRSQLSPFLSEHVTESNHYLCPRDLNRVFRLLYFRKNSVDEGEWEPCTANEGEIAIEVCDICLNVNRLHETFYPDHIKDMTKIIEVCKLFPTFHAYWQKENEHWYGVEWTDNADIDKEILPSLERLGVLI